METLGRNLMERQVRDAWVAGSVLDGQRNNPGTLDSDYLDLINEIAEKAADVNVDLRDVSVVSLRYFYDVWVAGVVARLFLGPRMAWVLEYVDWDLLSHALKDRCPTIQVRDEWFVLWDNDGLGLGE